MEVNMADEETIINLDPGACRFRTKVHAIMEDGEVKFRLESDCPYVKKLDQAMSPMPMMDILTMPFCENRIYVLSGKILKHSVCPVPMAILKCGEAAAGLGLKKDIKAEYQR
jgi:hypothetical protein